MKLIQTDGAILVVPDDEPEPPEIEVSLDDAEAREETKPRIVIVSASEQIFWPLSSFEVPL